MACVGILFIVGFLVCAKLISDSQRAIDLECKQTIQKFYAYAVYRQMHGYGVNPNLTDMHTSINANLYDFPNGPKN